MRAGLSVVTPPAVEPVTLAELKAHLRVDVTTDDTYITNLGIAARETLEDRHNVAFITQTLDQVMDRFPSGSEPIELLRSPISSVTSVTYTDQSGASIVWGATNYRSNLYTKPPRIAPAFGQWWPIVILQPISAVTIRIVAGHANAAACPARLKQAVYFLAGHWYENREPVITGTITAELAKTLDDIMEPWRPRQFA